jgi:hypothetical protein
MPYGYLGQNTPNQTVSNSGVFSISDVADLEKQGKFGGSLEFIEEQVADGTTTYIDFLTLKEDVYDVHYVTFNNIQWGTADTFGARVSDDGGTTFEATSSYDGALQQGNTAGSFSEATRVSYTSFDRILQNQANLPHSGYCYFYNLGDSSKYSFMTQQTLNWGGGNMQFKFGGGVYKVASTINALRFFNGTYNLLSGSTIKLYGVKQL